MDGLMSTQSHAFLLSTGRSNAGQGGEFAHQDPDCSTASMMDGGWHGGGPGGHYTGRFSDTLAPIRYAPLGERA